MEKTENFGQFLLNRLGRCAYATVGLLICALGTYIQIQANFGMSPWASLNQGLALNFPISYGIRDHYCCGSDIERADWSWYNFERLYNRDGNGCLY